MKADEKSLAQQEENHRQQIRQGLVLLGLTALVYLSHHGILTWILDTAFNQHILAVGHSYLDTAQTDALETLTVINVIKTGLAVIQSSSGGISFFIDVQVQLGELFNVFSEVINRAWQVSWLALAAIETMKLLLDFSRFTLTPLLTISFIFLGFGYGLSLFPTPKTGIGIKQLYRGCYYLSKWGFFLLIMIHLIIPVSIFVVSSGSSLLFPEKKQEIHREFVALKALMEDHQKESSLHSQVRGTISAFKTNKTSVHQQSGTLSALVVKHAVYSLAEHLVLPLLLMIIFSVILRRFMHRNPVIFFHKDAQ
ncbi:MAG: hypothetical protein MJE63_09435 [Proteobacteria bacterium]|nr:hypothetical protein [Pseudomonadota bacterium]